MNKWHRIKDLALLGAIAVSFSLAQTSRAVPITKEQDAHGTTIKLSTQASNRIALDITELFGPGVTTSAEARSGAVDYSEDNLVEFRHLKEPPNNGPKSGKNNGPTFANVPDGGSASMMLGGTLGGMAFLKRKLRPWFI